VPYEGDGLATVSLTIAVVAALFLGALWALRRTRANSVMWGESDCRIVRSLALGPRERLLVVRIGSKHLVIGVSSAALSLLCELDEPLPPIVPANAKFGEAVRKAVGRWHGE
jgi:flagellar protein FliO/FliZ